MPNDSSCMDRLIEVVRILRGPNGCPWDREQTLDSLKQYLVEETYELVDAIDGGDPDKHLEELGDVLLQIVLQSQIRSEQGTFAFDDVARVLVEKLVRRHPHVFGGDSVSDSNEVLKRWEKIKYSERGSEKSVFDGMPRHLPALQKAQKAQVRAARVGFDWESAGGILAKIEEECAEVREAIETADPGRIREEIGDLLFSVVNLARREHVVAEEALNESTSKFVKRFMKVEQNIVAGGESPANCSPERLEAEWQEVKSGEK